MHKPDRMPPRSQTGLDSFVDRRRVDPRTVASFKDEKDGRTPRLAGAEWPSRSTGAGE